MRTKHRRGAKSQAIRAYLQHNPNASAPEVVVALGRQGLKVTPAFVYMLRSLSKKKRKGRRKVAPAAARNGRSRSPAAAGLSAEHLVAAKKLADQLGGTDALRGALELLDKLR
jgi:hypothetical protein